MAKGIVLTDFMECQATKLFVFEIYIYNARDIL